MGDSFLSFANSSSFRNSLLSRNLPPYTVTGVYTPPSTNVVQETNLTVSNVVNSPDELISRNPYVQQLYPLNPYGPDGGYNYEITYNNPPLPVDSNQGEYDPNDTKLDLINEFFIDAAYIENVYGPNGGFQNMVTITDLQLNNKIYAPYWDPPTFVPSFYTPYEILISNNPTGDNGLLSQDSYIAKIGAQTLKNLLQERVDAEILKNTVGLVNLESLQDPFEASLIATGREPFIYRNWRITVAENPLLRAVNFTTRLVGAYWPVSPIPGDYFIENVQNGQSKQTSNALNVVNQLTLGALGPILNKTRNPSEIFLANTGNGQRSALFNSIEYNRYRPDYNRNFGGIIGAAQNLVNLAVDLINPDNGTLVGGYYVGSRNAEPSTITSPPNQVPVNPFGQQVQSPIYGPSEMGILFEGNISQLNFGLQGKSSTDGGSLDGNFVWVSPKYKSNAGFKATPGGGSGSIDSEYNEIRSDIERNLSTNVTLKESSILDNTQRLIDSADNVQGISRLKHVGNAMNQISKVFHDGYKEITKGSQVVSYTDNTTGSEKGIEYCRVFTKDTPYYTYADLQKTDGITTSGRQFTNSVLDNTFNLNIVPLRGNESTNVKENEKGIKVAKKYMFSIENLAWRTSSKPDFRYEDLPTCEKGPNGGRVMWFPPYDLKFTDSSSADWNPTNFLGRPEPIYTYKQTSRSGTLSWKIIVDHPSVMNTIIEKQLKNQSSERITSIIDSFFAGCVKYDIYELARKFNQIPIKDLFLYQELLDQRPTKEQLEGILRDIPSSNLNQTQTGVDPRIESTTNTDNRVVNFQTNYLNYGFYFDNDIPDPKSKTTTTSSNYQDLYGSYLNQQEEYKKVSENTFDEGSNQRNTDVFFDNIIKGNYEKITQGESNFITDAYNILKDGGNITITLVGSASAIASTDYNYNISQRRIESVKNFFKTFSVGGNSLKEYIDNGKFIIKSVPKGEEEEIINTKGKGSDINTSINCRELVKDKNNSTKNKNAQVYSTNSMACRRVVISDITANLEQKNEEVIKKPEENDPKVTIKERIGTPKPRPVIDTTTDVKKGISKKILRQLLSECDYFEVIKETNPMVYSSIKEKIKYFNPAFHSMTPEGLNARLTFLNQCVRPGETIPVIGTDGRPKVNDAINTSFGSPPVLVLRIGDFYNTKIIPTSLSFSYDPLIYDINPEGIGVQPMIANVTLNFNFIGGSGLAKPVEQLQNALSFNYYGNTEIYDERAVATEDTSKLDKKLVDAIVDGEVTNKQITNQQPNDGGSTIGTIKTNIPVEGGQTGQTSYQVVMDDLLNQTRDYFNNVVNQLKTINNNTENGNYGLVQFVNSGRTNTEQLIVNDKVMLYGKPNYEPNVTKLFTEILNDIFIDNNVIIRKLLSKNFKNPTLVDDIKTNLRNYLENYELTFSNNISVVTQELVNNQINIVQTLRKLNLIVEKTDGLLLSGNVPRVYNISGITYTTKDGNDIDTYNELTNDYIKFKPTVDKYNTFLKTKKLVSDNGYTDFITGTLPDEKIFKNLSESYDRRFFLVMSRVITDKSRSEDFTKKIIGNLIGRDKSKSLERIFNNIIKDLSDDYNKYLKYYSDDLESISKSPEYITLTNGIETEMYKSGKDRIFDYTTIPGANNEEQGNKIKDLYLNQPKFN